MGKNRFAIGHNVQLISGGPQMTIVGRSEKGKIECCWFDKEQKERRSTFPETALVATPTEEMSNEQLEALVQQISKGKKSEKKTPLKPL